MFLVLDLFLTYNTFTIELITRKKSDTTTMPSSKTSFLERAHPGISKRATFRESVKGARPNETSVFFCNNPWGRGSSVFPYSFSPGA